MPVTLVTDSVLEAAQVLRRGGIVAFPTETVYGLGADALDARAVGRVFEAKNRPADNPTIVHVADPTLIASVASSVPPAARRLLDHFSPGPLTVVLRRAAGVPDNVTSGLDTVAVRIPSHPVARALLRAFDAPVAAPSANLSGRPSPTTWQAVVADLDGRIDCVLKGGESEVGLESTVVDCCSAEPAILRPGAISAEAIADVLGMKPASLIREEPDAAGTRSPGTRHPHYAPRCPVVLVEPLSPGKPVLPEEPRGVGYIGLIAPANPAVCSTTRVCETPVEYARALYAFFRDCEARNTPAIYCQRVAPHGVGAAIMDRIERAAAATSS